MASPVLVYQVARRQRFDCPGTWDFRGDARSGILVSNKAKHAGLVHRVMDVVADKQTYPHDAPRLSMISWPAYETVPHFDVQVCWQAMHFLPKRHNTAGFGRSVPHTYTFESQRREECIELPPTHPRASTRTTTSVYLGRGRRLYKS